MEIKIDEVWLRPSDYKTRPIEIRIGDPTSPGSRYRSISVSEARQLAYALLAVAEERENQEE